MGARTRRVLVVDDDPDFSDAVVQILAGMGYGVLCARDGLEALGLLEGLGPEAWPALVLLDVRMPGMDGEKVRARLKGVPALAGIPVVMISGQSPAGRVGEPFEGFLLKPLDLETLLGVARHYCGGAGLAPEASA